VNELAAQLSSVQFVKFTKRVQFISFAHLYGSMAQWLANLEFELGDPGSNPGSCHYSIG